MNALSEHSLFGLGNSRFHRIVYSDWGSKDGDTIICVHGLTGNGRDFDYLASALATQGYRVIAIDMPGRGRSDFLTETRDYNFRQYVQDLTALMAHIGVDASRSIDWIGSSMGGLLGIRLAAMEDSPIRRMILNDIGPYVPEKPLSFITQCVPQADVFDTLEDFEKQLRNSRSEFYCPLTDEQWRQWPNRLLASFQTGKLLTATISG